MPLYKSISVNTRYQNLIDFSQLTKLRLSISIVLSSIAGYFLAVEVIKWTRVSPGKFSFFSPINFKNYKFLILVVIISALLNGLLVNLTISLINDAVTIDVITVFRFFIGDFIGASVLIFALWIIFSTLVDTRLIMTPDE